MILNCHKATKAEFIGLSINSTIVNGTFTFLRLLNSISNINSLIEEAKDQYEGYSAIDSKITAIYNISLVW